MDGLWAASRLDFRQGPFLRLTPSTQRESARESRRSWTLYVRRRHVRLNPSGRDRIDLNVVRGKLNGHGLGQLDYRSFRRAVRGDEP